MGQILLNGIVKSYGKEVVVKNLDLTVEPGEFLTILGPSGCGKTTLLRIIAGLETPDSGGEIWFDSDNVTDLPVERRQVGMVFSHTHYFQICLLKQISVMV